MKHAVTILITLTITLAQALHAAPIPATEAPAPQEAAGPDAATALKGQWRLRSNAVGWAMLVSNAAVEYDFAERWSVALPIYYSGLNYFTRTLKFRTLTIQPEVRYWFAPGHKGWFAGAHLGVGYFNYATPGHRRVQDHAGRNPAYGGGIAGGWRFDLGSSGHWQMELSAGVGVYRAYYDKYVNTTNGPMTSTGLRTTYFGVDQAAASVIYVF